MWTYCIFFNLTLLLHSYEQKNTTCCKCGHYLKVFSVVHLCLTFSLHQTLQQYGLPLDGASWQIWPCPVLQQQPYHRSKVGKKIGKARKWRAKQTQFNLNVKKMLGHLKICKAIESLTISLLSFAMISSIMFSPLLLCWKTITPLFFLKNWKWEKKGLETETQFIPVSWIH